MTARVKGGAVGLLLLLALAVAGVGPADAATRLTLTGPSLAGPISPDADGRFAFPNVPLRRNSVNVFTVTASDDLGNTLTREVRVTQLSLDAIAVSKVTAEPLSVQQVQQLVADGVIKLDDPENFNVSQFNIVLTIGRQPVPISVPIAVPKNDELPGFETIKIPTGDSGNGGEPPKVVDVIVFELPVPPQPGAPPPPRIPGVIIIEGRIKSLKEFYSVRFLLMNTSGIFTLKDVRAMVEFPSGGLSHTLPADGVASLGDILPGNGDQPGQAEREFIIRGDEIGVRPVRVSFGGAVGGPGIPEDLLIPFNGGAETTVEVKGPPTFQVQVIHPPAVVADVPYELVVNITNTGETPALYASLELDMGAAAELVDCTVSDTGVPSCEPIDGPAVRTFGHIFPGKTVSETFTVLPHDTGPITSCLGIADQNITLQVHVGNLGCLVGSVPPLTGVPNGAPTVRVVPAPNLLGVGIDSPVVAFFSKAMNTATITASETGTFRVLDDQGKMPPGRVQIEAFGDRTVVIWQVEDGITNRLAPDTEYRVFLSQDIRDLQGNALANPWSSRFTTTNPVEDRDPPALTLSVEPPVNPNHVVSGQIVRINAYASDQGTGVQRVELYRQDTDTPGARFELVDQKTVFETTSGPCIFSVDSAKLTPGRTYQFLAAAYDKAGNRQDATIPVIMAAAVAPPSIELPADPADPVPQGIAFAVVPAQVSAGVKTVHYFLDGASQPLRTITIAPFQATIPTVSLAEGPHTIRAVAVDGLEQTGEDTLAFVVGPSGSGPQVGFGGAVDGATYPLGASFTVTGTATDPAGIQSVAFYLDAVGGTPLAAGLLPFTLNTTGLALGSHRIIIVATNRLGVSNDPVNAASVLDFSVVQPGTGAPPPPPGLAPLLPPQNGLVTVQGTAAPGARVDVTNVTLGLTVSVTATSAGAFSTVIDAAPGHVIRAVTVDPAQSSQPSAPTQATVPAPVALARIDVAPATVTLNAANAFADLAVTAVYADDSTAVVTAQSTFLSSAPAVASVNGAGRVVALTSGPATITASFGGKQTTAAVTISIRTLLSVAINPSAFTLSAPGATRQLALVGTYSDSTTGTITSGVTWATSAPAFALVNATGLVTAAGFGQATITATVSGLPPAQSTVTVSPAAPVSISVSPSSILFVAASETRQLLVTRTLSDGTTEPAPAPITYQTSDAAVATVSATGLVTAVATGDATITVRHLGLEATAAVTVDIPVVTHPPEIAAIDRPRAAEGDPFTIRGRHFAALPAQNVVLVNGLSAVVDAARQDELTVRVPVGATSGAVTVQVGGSTSNAVTLDIYARRARSTAITGAVDVTATPGQTLTLTLPNVVFRAGDVALLSSAPDTPVPLDFGGTLRAKVDGGAFATIAPSSTEVPDLTALFTPGTHTLTLELREAGGRIQTDDIFLFVGPDDTGPIAGDRQVVAVGQSRPITVTFTDIRDLAGNPLPDGAKVAITTGAIGVTTPDGCCAIGSAGGNILNGQGVSPNDTRFAVFTVVGGRVDVLYDPGTALAFGTATGGLANLQLIPADAAGNRIGFRATAVEPVTLTTLDTGAAPRTQASVVADGTPKVVTVRLTGLRDTAGNLVPDGTRVAVTTGAIGVVTPDGCCAIGSVGGSILNAEGLSPNDSRFGVFTVTGGEVVIQYDPGAVLLPVGDVRVANVQVLPATADGQRIGFRAFSVVPITLSSPTAQSVNISVVPTSALADSADNRVTITVSGITDTLGNPVPDGTRIAVTTGNIGVTSPDGCCAVGSAGGTIVNAQGASPNDSRFAVLMVTGGQAQIVYSTEGAAVLATRQTATARVQILPATPSGDRIGFRAFAVADIALTGYQTAETQANPPSAIADGLSKIVTVTLTGIRDTAGNLVPNGSKVAVTTGQIGVTTPDGCCGIGSAGGAIVNGQGTSANDTRFRYFTVQNGQVIVQYDPLGVLLSTAQTATANVQVLPAAPNGDRIGFRAFAVASILLSSPTVPAANVTVAPATALADGADNRVTVTVTGITDALGRPVPNGTKVAVTTGAIGVTTPDGCCGIGSAGGSIVNGQGTSPNDGRFVHLTVTGGQVQIVYSAQGAAPLGARSATTARVQVLPADPSGNVIGFRAFAVADVGLTGYQSAIVTGPGALAPGATGTYVVSDIRDTAGNLVPNGSKIAVTAGAIGVTSPDGCCGVGSAGGSILNGDGASPNDGRFRYFTVQADQISVQFQAPASGTAVLQLLPAGPDGTRHGFRAFELKAVQVAP